MSGGCVFPVVVSATARWSARTSAGQCHNNSNGGARTHNGSNFDQDGARSLLFRRRNSRSGWPGSRNPGCLYRRCHSCAQEVLCATLQRRGGLLTAGHSVLRTYSAGAVGERVRLGLSLGWFRVGRVGATVGVFRWGLDRRCARGLLTRVRLLLRGGRCSREGCN